MSTIESDGAVVPVGDLVMLAGGRRAVAEKAGVRYNSVCRLLIDPPRLNADFAERLAAALGLSVVELRLAADAQRLRHLGYRIVRVPRA